MRACEAYRPTVTALLQERGTGSGGRAWRASSSPVEPLPTLLGHAKGQLGAPCIPQAQPEPTSGSASELVTDERDGGALTWRVLITRVTPETLRASCSASVFTCVVGTSPAPVTTPLVTWTSTALSSDTTLPRRTVREMHALRWRPGVPRQREVDEHSPVEGVPSTAPGAVALVAGCAACGRVCFARLRWGAPPPPGVVWGA